jgi:hypothetical protein
MCAPERRGTPPVKEVPEDFDGVALEEIAFIVGTGQQIKRQSFAAPPTLPKSPPEPCRPTMIRTFYEICCISGGRPTLMKEQCGTINEARALAKDKCHSSEQSTYFELAANESLADQTRDGIYLCTKRTEIFAREVA